MFRDLQVAPRTPPSESSRRCESGVVRVRHKHITQQQVIQFLPHLSRPQKLVSTGTWFVYTSVTLSYHWTCAQREAAYRVVHGASDASMSGTIYHAKIAHHPTRLP